MTELGIGTRVWVEWRPDSDLQEGLDDDPRCRTGTVQDGPFTPVPFGNGRFGLIGWEPGHGMDRRFWSVLLDGSTEDVCCKEDRLHPLDGGSLDSDEDHEDTPETVEAT